MATDGTIGKPAAGRRSYPLYVLLLIVVANTLSYADRHVFAVLIPAIKGQFGLDDRMIGFIGGPAFILTFVLFSLPFARLADSWSRRGVLSLSILVWSVATAACGLAANAWQLTAARLAVGMGEAGGMPPSQSMISSLFGRRRNTALGALGATPYLGVLLGLGGGGLIAEAYGWRAAFLALAVPGIPLALLIWLTGPRRAQAAKSALPTTEQGKGGILHCLRIRALVLTGLGVGIFNIFGTAGALWLPSYFVRSHAMTIAEAGLWLSLGAAAGGIIGSFVAGALVDALAPRDPRWQLRVPATAFVLSFPLFVFMFMLPGGASVALLGFPVPLVALISMTTAFLSSFWTAPSLGAAARLVPAAQRAQAVGLIVVFVNVIGSLLGPTVAGLVSDVLKARYGAEALRYSLLAMSVLPIVGGLILWRAASYYPREMIRQD